MRCNFYLRNPDPKKKGRTAIYLTATYRGQRCILYPGESIDKDDWDNKKFKPKPIAGNNALIGRLNRFEQLVRDTHDDLQKSIKGVVPAKVLQKEVLEKISPTASQNVEAKPILIIEFFQTLIDDSKSGARKGPDRQKLNENSIKPYKSALNHFKSFQNERRRQYHLNDINQNLVNAFTNYLETTKNLALNACAKYLTVFKLLITYAQQKKLVDPNLFLTTQFYIRRGKSDNIFLTESQIEELMKIDIFPTELYQTVRDLFVIGCWTGLRFSDYSALRLENVNFKEGIIVVTQRKVSAKVVIPIHRLVKQILQKYPQGLPKCPPNQVFNRYLKEIGKQIPDLNVEFEKRIVRSDNKAPEVFKKWELLQTHTARRSFCTNMFLKGVPERTIMAISGHQTQENFYKYIKAENLRHARIAGKAFDDDNNMVDTTR